MTRILLVCLGNICRSPTAEAVLRRLVEERGLAGSVEVDSAGTGGWHVGEPPDRRAAAAARGRGLTLTGTARQVGSADFHTFDLLLGMDAANVRALREAAPPGTAGKVHRLADTDVPDPYYGGPDGFERVLDVVEAGCREWLDRIAPR